MEFHMTPKYVRLFNYMFNNMVNDSSNTVSHYSFLLRKKIVSHGKSIAIVKNSRMNPLPSIHAEHDCLRKFNFKNLSRKKRQALALVVFKVDREGNLKNSKPCQHCLKLLKRHDIGKVIYSNNDGTFISEIVRDMQENTCIVSQGFRHLLLLPKKSGHS